MTPSKILTAIELGQTALDEEHGALRLLWRRFGEAVREARRKKDMPLKEFAGALGYSTGMIGLLETGKRDWSMDKAKLAIEILKK